MLKRKFGDRSEWLRVIERKYSQSYLDIREIKGFTTLLKTLQVTEPLTVNYGEKTYVLLITAIYGCNNFPLKKSFCNNYV